MIQWCHLCFDIEVMMSSKRVNGCCINKLCSKGSHADCMAVPMLKASVRTPNLICGNTFTPQNNKIHIKQPISTISTSQTWARVYIFSNFNKRLNNSCSVIRHCCMIGQLIGTCQSEEMVNFAIMNHFQTIRQLK